MPTPNSPHRRRPTRPRRGAAYLLVLSSGILLSVVGFGILSSSRANSRGASQAADLDEAAALAEAATAWGMSAISANNAWRTTYTHGVETTAKTMGRGTVAFKLVDEVDGNLSNNASDAVRLCGIGRVGSAVRRYSVQLIGTGGSLDVLKAPLHSAGNLTVNDNVTVIGGALSTNGALTVAGGKTVTGSAQYTTLPGSGTVSGTKTALTSPLAMPQSTAFDTYKALATTIPFANITSGQISKKVLSPGTNTVYAAAGLNAGGVYYIKVPASATLKITTSRLAATLVVELDAGATFTTTGTFAWEPPRADYPSLIVKGAAGSTVTLEGSTSGATTLVESTSLTNFNPAATPYPYVGGSGTSNSTSSDTYPSEFHGLLHVIGSGVTTNVQNYFTLVGAAVFESGATIKATGVKLTADPTLASTPPSGYTAATVMVPAAGTWKWE